MIEPVLILPDIAMPERDGPEMARGIQHWEQPPLIAFLSLSRTSRNRTGKKHPRSCAKLLDVQPIYVLANVLEQAGRNVVTHWV